MVLRLHQLEADDLHPHAGADNWLPPRMPLFMGSPTYELMRRDIRRYVEGEILGRAYLIAGHRGTGKTALVLRAVQDIRAASLKSGTDQRRPLLVKLHGPSLFSGELPGQPAKPDATLPERLQGALAHITVALYRALASEVVSSFRIHAMQSGAQRDRSLELAASLQLELDGGPTAAALRAYWRRLDRLAEGILWPAGREFPMPDQGMREIVALATAAQAFQVCIGAVKYETKSEGADALKQVNERKSGLDLAPALNRMISVVGGAALGTGIAATVHSATAGATAGIAATLLSAMAFTSTSTRSRDRSESESHNFIRDFSVTTLDRDLPEVIQRIRRAGLAPIFLVDELDKMPGMTNPAAAAPAPATGADAAAPSPVPEPPDYITKLVDRLKNLTTDYGFFCFLTDRSYYEALRKKLRDSAYPPEHTYFSAIEFVMCPATEQMRYLLRAVTRAAETTDSRANWLTLAFAARLRSQMNIINLMRDVSQHFDNNGQLRPDLYQLATLPHYQLAASMQFAIDLTLADSDVAIRTRDDPLLAQFLIDALYCLPRAWADDKEYVDLGAEALGAYLQARCRQGGYGVKVEEQISAEQIKFLSAAAVRTAGALTSFDYLRQSVSLFWSVQRQGLILPGGGSDPSEQSAIAAGAELIFKPTWPSGIVQADASKSDRFYFLMDSFGKPTQRCPPAQPAAAGTDNAAQSIPLVAISGVPNLNPNGSITPQQDEDAGLDTPLPQSIFSASNEEYSLEKKSETEKIEAAIFLVSIFDANFVNVSYLKEIGAVSPTIPDESTVRYAIQRLDPGGKHEDGDTIAFSNIINAFIDGCSNDFVAIAFAISLTKRVIDLAIASDATSWALNFAIHKARAAIAHHIRIPPEVRSTQERDIGKFLEFSKISAEHEGLEIPVPAAPSISSLATWKNEIANWNGLILTNITESENPWNFWRDQVVGFICDNTMAHRPIRLAQLGNAARGISPDALFRLYPAMMTVQDWSDIIVEIVRTSLKPEVAPWAIPAALRALGFDRRVLLRIFIDGELQPMHLATKRPLDTDELQVVNTLVSTCVSETKLYTLLVLSDAASDLANEVPSGDGRAVLAIARRDLPVMKDFIEWLESWCELTTIYV